MITVIKRRMTQPVPLRAKPRVCPLGGKEPGWDGKINQQQSKKGQREEVKGQREGHCGAYEQDFKDR